ncbi:MAG: hypothetical protein ACK58T_30685, partial [Phycisphaerae bacterium]
MSQAAVHEEGGEQCQVNRNRSLLKSRDHNLLPSDLRVNFLNPRFRDEVLTADDFGRNGREG